MTHGRLTSLPSATVTFGIGSANIGGSESAATYKYKRYQLYVYMYAHILLTYITMFINF